MSTLVIEVFLQKQGHPMFTRVIFCTWSVDSTCSIIQSLVEKSGIKPSRVRGRLSQGGLVTPNCSHRMLFCQYISFSLKAQQDLRFHCPQKSKWLSRLLKRSWTVTVTVNVIYYLETLGKLKVYLSNFRLAIIGHCFWPW